MSGQVKKLSTEVPDIPYDVVFKILLLLPAGALYRLSFVCKTWYNLIYSSAFIEAHTRQCETVLVFLKEKRISDRGPNTYCIGDALGLSDDSTQFSLFMPSTSGRLGPESYIHLLEFQDAMGKVSEPNICGFGKILATCNGLILATSNKYQRLLVMNPMTRKLIGFPVGTRVLSNDETYGFVFDQHKQEYKVVHLYRDSQRFIGCEIFSLRTRSWQAIDGPSSVLFRSFERKLVVTATGAIYWLPGKRECSYLVSISMDNEKFFTRALPVDSTTQHDDLVEIGGILSFVAHATKYRMHVWISRRNEGVEDWVKQYTINMDYDIGDLIPLFATRNGRKLVFKRDEKRILCTYDLQDEEMKKVELETGVDYNPFFRHLPHLNTLASWVNPRPM